MTNPSPRRRRLKRASGVSGNPGRAQLTLVEHALCPLDASVGLTEGLIHTSEFPYFDENRRARTGTARVGCLFGLSPGDEFYLWGLVALTLSQPEPSVEFHATPYYCLSELGLIDAKGRQERGGGKNYTLFREAIARLSGVTYRNDQFYDPVRGERRSVSFGFLSYSLPTDPGSSRAWRIVWDPIFFEFCQAARGSLVFDLETYRALDHASRRLFLLLKKIFHRNPQSPSFDVRHLAVNVLGFAPTIETRNLKVKLGQCASRLAEHGVVKRPESGGWFVKKGVGQYSVRFQRGAYFERPAPEVPRHAGERSPLHGPLQAIGFDEAAIGRILKKYKPALVQVWADITLAAKERSPGFFKVSPQAYFIDNVEKASKGTRTPPDWWYDHRKEEDRREREGQRTLQGAASSPKVENEEEAFEVYLQGEGRQAFEEIVGRLRTHYKAAGQRAQEAARSAQDSARTQMRNRFRHEHPEVGGTARSLGEILAKFRPE